MKVKCVVCGNYHSKDYCSVINPNMPNMYKDQLNRIAKLNLKKGKITYICDLCQS